MNRSKSRFEEDESIPELWRAKLKDYFKSGYDRGHMVSFVRRLWVREGRDGGVRLTKQKVGGRELIIVAFGVLG